MINKVCRLCQNTDQWRHPTAKKGENTRAYTYKYGFGFEEWLGRREWVLSGYPGQNGKWRYAHIQGLWTKYNKYVGEDVRLLFYTKKVGYPALAAALLDHAHVIDEDEALWVTKQYQKNGWDLEMLEDVKKIGGKINGLPPASCKFNRAPWDSPLFFANIRFRPDALHFFDESVIVNVSSFYYGKALDWNGTLPDQVLNLDPVSVPQPLRGDKSPSKIALNRFSEAIRTRRGINGKSFLPRQAPIQNALALQLQDYFGQRGATVTCEDERVDIKLVTANGEVTFFEIKPANSAREAIRLALGQLLEYAHYPNRNRVIHFAIVSDAEQTERDMEYLAYLAEYYSLTVSYFFWSPENKCLSNQQLQLLA